MSLEPIGVITGLLGTVGLFYSIRFITKAFIVLTLFGAAGAILLTGSGTIQPGHLMLGFFASAILLNRDLTISILRKIRFPTPEFWLLCFSIFAVFSAYFFPRLFAGATQTNAIGITDYGPSIVLVPLGPSSGNLTQSIYIIADFVCFGGIAAVAQYRSGLKTVVGALITYSLLNVLFAFMDIITFWTQTAFLMDPLRNANYAFHLEETTGGLKRIAGVFTETSAFSSATLGSFAFMIKLWLDGMHRSISGLTALISLFLLVLSTSSTALAALPVMISVIYLISIGSFSAANIKSNATKFALLSPLAVCSLILIVLLNTELRSFIWDFLNITLFSKAESESGQSRGSWNRNAYQNFLDTSLMGAGLGSVRSSSFALALISNVGLIGTTFFVLFVLSVLSQFKDIDDREVKSYYAAALLGCLGIMLCACVSGTLVDLGLPFYILSGMAVGMSRIRSARESKE